MILQNIRKHPTNKRASQPMTLESKVTTLRNISTDRKYFDWLHNYQLLKDSASWGYLRAAAQTCSCHSTYMEGF